MGIASNQGTDMATTRLLVLAACLAVAASLPSELGAQDEPQPKVEVEQQKPYLKEDGTWGGIPDEFNIVDQVEDALAGKRKLKLGEGAGAGAGFTNQGRFAWDMSHSTCASKATDEVMTKFCTDRPKMHCNGAMRDWFCDQTARIAPEYEVMCPSGDDKQGFCEQVVARKPDSRTKGRCCSWNRALADPTALDADRLDGNCEFNAAKSECTDNPDGPIG